MNRNRFLQNVKSRDQERVISPAEWGEMRALHGQIESVERCMDCAKPFAHNSVRVYSKKDYRVRCQECSLKGRNQ